LQQLPRLYTPAYNPVYHAKVRYQWDINVRLSVAGFVELMMGSLKL